VSTAGLFVCRRGEKSERSAIFLRGREKYNPTYNLQTMLGRRETTKLEARGKTMNRKNGNDNKNQNNPSAGAHGRFFEIRVKGHLDNSWSDWLEGLEVRLLDNGEMILLGQIRDQAALIGILNRLYGLNISLLSVSEVNQKK
jgi:hypothetical protein